MDDTVFIDCPFCGERLELYVEPDVHGAFIQDCEVCCNPMRVIVTREDDELYVNVARGDGSE